MGWFSDDSEQAQAYEEVNSASHKAELSHEVIAAAASFDAMKAYESHCAVHGTPENHATATEILAAFSGAFVDRIVEAKGLGFIDDELAKSQARQQLAEASSQDY